MSYLYFILANALIIGCCLFGLRAAHRRLKRQRILLVVLLSLFVTWSVSMLIERMSEPPPPAEGPDSADAP